MLFDSDLDSKRELHEKRFKELLLHFQTLEKEVADLYAQLDLTPQDISNYVDNKENFSEEVWKQLELRKKEMEEKLQTKLSNICNPAKTKQAFQSLNTRPHWIHVR